jgi:hypothetical protein
MSTNTDPRTAYEFFLGKRVSDNHWYSVKRALTDNNMEITNDNVVFYAKLRRDIKRTSVNVVQVFEYRKKAEKLLALNDSKITGERILEILAGEGIKPHMATISRWFKPLGGFRKTRWYYPEKLVSVITSALLYKVEQSNKRLESN